MFYFNLINNTGRQRVESTQLFYCVDFLSSDLPLFKTCFYAKKQSERKCAEGQ